MIPAPGHVTYLSTSAVAHGDYLGVVMDRMLRDGHTYIEIGIGPRPEPLGFDVIAQRIEWGAVVTAHANCPIGNGTVWNQERDFPWILVRCAAVGVHRYTVHAPRKRDLPTWGDFVVWASDKWAQSMEVGPMHFGVETMYPDRSPYWLDSYDEVSRFLDWADEVGWERPLVADVAHLQIGVEQGTWTEPQVEYVLKCGQTREFHYSDNDGVHDKHRPYVAGRNERIDRWLGWAREDDPGEVAFVDEGRRRA